MNRRGRFGRALALLAVAAGILTSILLVAQPYPPPWRDVSAGIRRSVTINALAASADQRTLYAAAYEPDGLARSTDGGLTWQRVAPLGGWAVPLSVAVAPKDARRVYVGLVSPGGARRSTDGGLTWAELPAFAGASVNAWLFAPDGTLYAGTSAGLHASTDGGDTWAPVPGAPDHAVLALLLDPVDQQTLSTGHCVYVGTDQGGVHVRDSAGWRGGGEGHVNGLVGDPVTGRVYTVALHRLFRTTDKGRTWQEVPWPAEAPAHWASWWWATRASRPPQEVPWPADVPPPLSLGLVSTADGPILYAGAVESQGLYRSADEGVTWQRLDGPASIDLYGTTVLCFAVNPVPAGGAHVFVGTDGVGLFRSADYGDTWEPADMPLGQPRLSTILPHPTRPGVVFAGAADGVYKSTDSGALWRRVSGALGRLDVLALAAHPQDPNIIYAGASTGVYRSTDGGDSWHPWMTSIPGVTIYSFTFDPTDPATIYAGSRGNNVCRTTNGGVTWAPIHNGLETLTAFAVLVDARNPQVLTVGTVEDVYRSVDGGETWWKLEGPLEGLTTFCLLEVEGQLYAGTTDGVYVSRDRGSTWTARRQGMGTRTVVSLVRDPARPAVLYSGTEGAGLYRSTDGGNTWQAWARVQPAIASSVYALAFDPFDHARLYAATDRGAFVLTTWTP